MVAGNTITINADTKLQVGAFCMPCDCQPLTELPASVDEGTVDVSVSFAAVRGSCLWPRNLRAALAVTL